MSNISIISYLVLTAALGYAFIYPSYQEVSGLWGEQDKYNASIETVNNIEAKKNELLDQYNQIPEEDRKNIDTILPSSFDFTRLVAQIDAAAAKNGISIKTISGEENKSLGADSVEEAGPQSPYHAARIKFSFDATYEQFQEFMGSLEKSLRILDIKNVSIKSNEKGIYSYDIQLNTYWLN